MVLEKFCSPGLACFARAMAYEMTGTVKEIFDEQTFGSGFNKREFVLTNEEDKYPQDISFECLKDKVTLVDPLNKGDKVTVHFDIRGREWKGRYFVNLVAWKIDGASGGGGGGESRGDDPPPFDPADEILDEEPPF